MKYGCIGEKLKHSFSKEIHNALSDYEYELCEIARDELCSFAQKKDFRAINVTIPYKELIIPYLYYIDEFAKDIGAVNTVVNRDGLLYGYNTDFYGMQSLLQHAKIDIKNKKVIILGTGGTSKTAVSVARAGGAKSILRVSRAGRENAITYGELYAKHTDAEIIINTTPSGMFPNIFDTPVDISAFPSLAGVIDAVYNPLRTPLISAAKRRGIPAEGGLYMLVAQAVRASEIFLGTEYPAEMTDKVFGKLCTDKENIVLVGMPSSGKSTVGGLIAKACGRTFIDTDELIVKHAGQEITDIFAEVGEAGFRDIESQVIREVSAMTSAVIATGGGAVLREENVAALKENGKIYFIDRPLEKLIPTSSRPLSSDRKSIEKRYEERYGIYTSVCDRKINAACTPAEVAQKIMENFLK